MITKRSRHAHATGSARLVPNDSRGSADHQDRDRVSIAILSLRQATAALEGSSRYEAQEAQIHIEDAILSLQRADEEGQRGR